MRQDEDSKQVSGAPSPAAIIRRHTDISFPAKVPVGKTFPLRVQLVPSEETLPSGELRAVPKPHPHDVTLPLVVGEPAAPHEPPPPIRVNISVAAENFQIEGETHAQIIVPLVGRSPAVNFRLRGQQVGPGRIMIDFDQDGRPVGSVDLSPEVVPAHQRESEEPASSAGEIGIATHPGSVPDAVLTVFEFRLADRPGRLHFVFSTSDPRLQDLPVAFHGDLGTIDLNVEVADWVGDQLRRIGTLARQATANQEDVFRTLSTIGFDLFSQLLPKPLQDLHWTLRERGVRSLLILSDDPHIPWELVKPVRFNPLTGELHQEDGFWGESYSLGRWLRGRTPPSHFSYRRIVAMTAGGVAADPGKQQGVRDFVPDTSQTSRQVSLSSGGKTKEQGVAEGELAVFHGLEGKGAQVLILPASRHRILAALESGDFDLLHVVSHGQFGGPNAPDASALLMDDGPFWAAELSERMAAPLRSAAPLIFFNACHSGQTGFSLTRLGSWGARLVQLGCGGFIGSLWPVSDQAACKFAQAFYEALLAEKTLGNAMLAARRQVQEEFPNDPTWLAYCCYADPMATVTEDRP